MNTIGNKVIMYSSVDSTNNEAWRLINSTSISEGTIIRAGFQTAGKGQGGTSWESEAGCNLNISIVLRPTYVSVSNQFSLNQAVSIALCMSISDICPNNLVQIKWPNDIYINNKKVAGILIENSIVGSEFDVSVIGLGVNVNQLSFISDAPNPISLAQLSGHKLDLDDCLNRICYHFGIWINNLKNGMLELISHQYLNLLLGYRSKLQFVSDHKPFSAEIYGVNHDGKLILNVNGVLKEYDHKEVRFLL
jgi:BirA family transcriptional regulator, biotin operon repressor / biotin---[acetyl-CoA-carboxylase] ligase